MELGKNFKRLSKSIIPSRYELKIFPNFMKLDFNGTVSIDLDVIKIFFWFYFYFLFLKSIEKSLFLKILDQKDFIELHSLELNLTKIEYFSESQG